MWPPAVWHHLGFPPKSQFHCPNLGGGELRDIGGEGTPFLVSLLCLRKLSLCNPSRTFPACQPHTVAVSAFQAQSGGRKKLALLVGGRSGQQAWTGTWVSGITSDHICLGPAVLRNCAKLGGNLGLP